MAGALSARSATITIAAQTMARGVTLALTVGSTAIVARAVGLGVYADWITVLSLVALLAVVLDPGATPIIVRRLAQDPASAPRPEALLALRLGLACAALAVVVASSAALRGIHVAALAVVLGAQMLPRSLVLNATPFLQVDHRLHRQTALEAVCAASGLAALGGASALGANVLVLAVAGFLLPTALLAVLVGRELVRTPSFRLPPRGPQRITVNSVLREVAPLAGALALTTLYTRVNSVFVNIAETPSAVARFLFAFQFVEQAIVIAGIVAAALLPMLAARARRVDLLRDPAVHDLCIGMVAFGALGSGVMVAAAHVLCSLVGGARLAPADRYVVLLAPMATILMLAFTLGYLHVTIGMATRYLKINAIALAINVTLHSAFTLQFGASAAARIAWITEIAVVCGAFLPLWRASRDGRGTAVRAVSVFAGAVVGSELAAAGVLQPVVAGLLPALAALALGRRELLRIAGSIVPVGRRPGSSGRRP